MPSPRFDTFPGWISTIGACLLRVGASVLIALLLAGPGANPVWAELEISGQKEFRYRGYSATGSFSQFINDNPQFLLGDGFDQSLRLDVEGELFDNVRLELSFDDSLETREDQKLLVSVDGRIWDFTAGRMALGMDDTRYLLYNKRALGMEATGLMGKHLLTLMVARPEGRQRRQIFQGQGTEQEFLLSDDTGKQNIRVVQNSDVVFLDSRRLQRGTDYDIDYDEGSVLIRHHLLPIQPSSLLTVEFEADGKQDTSTGTLVALRDRYYFDGLQDPSDREPDDEYVALSFVTNNDENDSGAAGAPLESRLTVAGLDGQFGLGEDMLLRAEFAASRLQATATGAGGGGGGREEGTAFDLDLARKEGRLTFDLTHQEVSPRFQAVGRKEFVRLNERSDLLRDVRLTRLDADYDLNRRLAGNMRLDFSTTNLDEDPALPTSDFQALLTGLTYNLKEDTNLAIRRKVERRDELSTAGLTGHQNRDRDTAVLNAALFGLVTQASWEKEDNDSDLAGIDSTDYVNRRLSLGSGGGEKLGWSASIENQKRPGLGESSSGQLLLDLKPARHLKGNMSFLRRVESGRATSTSTEADVTANTGEIKFRYEPSKKLTLDVKGKAERRNRVVFVRDPRIPVLRFDPNEPRTVVAKEPVLRLLGSSTIRFRPSRRFDHRLQLRANREEELDSSVTLSENDAIDYRLKFAPTKEFRVLANWRNSGARNRAVALDRDQESRELELLRAFAGGLSTTLKRLDILADDRGLGVNERELSHGLTVEKILSRILTAEAGIEKKDRWGRFLDESWTARAGVRYSPENIPLRSELRYEHSSIDGVRTGGGQLESSRDKVTIRADYRINPETLVEVSMDLTDAGPTVEGEPGYRSVAGEAKVSVYF